MDIESILQQFHDRVGDIRDELSDAYGDYPEEVADGGFIAGALGKLNQAEEDLSEAMYRIHNAPEDGK